MSNLRTMGKNINRINVVLAEKRKSNKWLAEQLDCTPTTVSKWCVPMRVNHQWKHTSKTQNCLMSNSQIL